MDTNDKIAFVAVLIGMGQMGITSFNRETVAFVVRHTCHAKQREINERADPYSIWS